MPAIPVSGRSEWPIICYEILKFAARDVCLCLWLRILIHVVSRGQTCHFFKYTTKVKSAFKSQSVGNFVNLIIAAVHHFFGGLNLALIDVIGKTDIVVFGEKNA